VKLLRVLQEHEIQPVGGEKSFGVDVRIIAASNRPLEQEVEARRFRRDLYHRLSVVTVTVPPLRERSEDIPTLVDKHITYLAKHMNRHITGIHKLAMQALCHYPWPGNVRELNNVLERAILLCDDSEIMLEDLPGGITQPLPAAAPSASVGAEIERSVTRKNGARPESPQKVILPEQWLNSSLADMRKLFLIDLERQYIEGLLSATHGRINAAAKRADVPERSLYQKMHQFGLQKEDYRRKSGKAGSARK
jgi:DNA-binding NtrC family response regulator